MEIKKRVGLLIRAQRKERGWSQEELADRADIHRTFVSSIERLAGARLVRVEQSTEDARTKQIWITDEGRAARDSAVEATSELLGSLEADLETIDLVRLFEMLVKLRSILDDAR